MYHVNIYRYPKSPEQEWVMLVVKDANKVVKVDMLVSGDYKHDDVKCALIRGADEAAINGGNTLYVYDKNGFKVNYENYTDRLHPVSKMVTVKNYKEILKRGDEKINELCQELNCRQKNLEKK